MQKIRFYELEGVTEKDNEAILKCAREAIELSIDEYGRVYNEGGLYIADAEIVR